MWGWIAAAGVGLIAAVSFLQYRAQRHTYRPLASRQPPRPQDRETPLGMEATDIDAVTRVARRNEALERAHTNWNRSSGMGRGAETSIDPMPDDETYAKRFHTAYMRNRKKDT